MNCNYKVKMKDIQNKYKFKIFCAGYEYDDTELRNAINQRALISEAGRYVELELNPNTYVLTAKLRDKNNNVISTTTPIDLPLESMIVDCDYDTTTKSLIITLQNGNTTTIPLGDLIDGLATEEDLNEVRDNLEVVQNELNQYKTIYNVLPKVEDEGEALTLNDTGNATLKIDLKGNTTQFTTTGKNLFDTTLYGTKRSNGITLTTNDDGTYTLNGTSTVGVYTDFNLIDAFSIVGTGEEIVSANVISGTADKLVEFQLCQSSFRDPLYINVKNSTGNPTYRELVNGNTYTNTTIRIGGNCVCNNLRFSIQVEKGTTPTSFEKYTGGTASPNPDYPQEVEVVTGENIVTICGKNVFNIAKLENSGWQQPNVSTRLVMFLDKVPQGTKMSVTNKDTTNYRFSVGFAKLGYASRDNIIVNESGWQTTSTYTETASGEGYPFLQISRIDNGNIIASEVEGKFQFEYSDTPTTYEAYKGQTYEINLGNIELCKIGDYQDYIYKEGKKWYKYKAIDKVVLDGTNYFAGGTTGTNAYYIETNIVTLSDNSKALTISNMFQPVSYNNRVNGLNATYSQNGKAVIRTANNTTIDWSDATKRTNWLIANKPILYYVLATPTTTEITDTTLISQLNALASARSYTGQTNISQINNDAPFIISASALYDLNNLVTRVAILETE